VTDIFLENERRSASGAMGGVLPSLYAGEDLELELPAEEASWRNSGVDESCLRGVSAGALIEVLAGT
jgi:hypothetical protein